MTNINLDILYDHIPESIIEDADFSDILAQNQERLERNKAWKKISDNLYSHPFSGYLLTIVDFFKDKVPNPNSLFEVIFDDSRTIIGTPGAPYDNRDIKQITVNFNTTKSGLAYENLIFETQKPIEVQHLIQLIGSGLGDKVLETSESVISVRNLTLSKIEIKNQSVIFTVNSERAIFQPKL